MDKLNIAVLLITGAASGLLISYFIELFTRPKINKDKYIRYLTREVYYWGQKYQETINQKIDINYKSRPIFRMPLNDYQESEYERELYLTQEKMFDFSKSDINGKFQRINHE